MRVVLCDDHHLFAEALADQLGARGYDVVASVASLERLTAIVLAHDPDVVLLDLGFPEGCGLDAAHDLRAAGFTGRVVLCTGETVERLVATGRPVEAALRAGVVDRVVEKTADLPAIESALRGRPETGRARSEGPGFQRLTRREVEVLARLAEGLTTAEVADRLGVAPSTVHAHEKSARQRLGVRSRFEAVHQYVGASHGARGPRARSRV